MRTYCLVLVALLWTGPTLGSDNGEAAIERVPKIVEEAFAPCEQRNEPEVSMKTCDIRRIVYTCGNDLGFDFFRMKKGKKWIIDQVNIFSIKEDETWSKWKTRVLESLPSCKEDKNQGTALKGFAQDFSCEGFTLSVKQTRVGKGGTLSFWFRR